MPVHYVEIDEAIAAQGLRLVVIGNIPSPWTESAKGILHVLQVPYVAVRLDYGSDALRDWAGGRSGPVAVYDRERPRAGWAEILLLAERLATHGSLLPADAASRAEVFGLAHELCGEAGLGWSRRLQLVHVGLQASGGFPSKVAGYLAKKYGYTPELGARADARVASLLQMFAARLETQQSAGSPWLVGEDFTAADIYLACFMALLRPLGEDVCRMDPVTRAAFETRDAVTDAAVDPILLAHRERVYAERLEMPLSL